MNHRDDRVPGSAMTNHGSDPKLLFALAGVYTLIQCDKWKYTRAPEQYAYKSSFCFFEITADPFVSLKKFTQSLRNISEKTTGIPRQ